MWSSHCTVWLMTILVELLKFSSAEYRSNSIISGMQPNGIPDSHSDGSRSSLHYFRETAVGLKRLSKGHRVMKTVTHVVTFVVKQKNAEELTRLFHDVSDPSSKNYGNFMTQKEVKSLTSF